MTLPSWSDVSAVALPVSVLGLSLWAIWRANRIVDFLFPDAEWERSLGWLNIKAEKRAKRALRWLSYGIVILLLDSLFGIAWALGGLPDVADWKSPAAVSDLVVRFAVLVGSLIVWGVYLGGSLWPRLRAEREEAGRRKFVAELDKAEERRPVAPPRRRAPQLQPPRSDAGSSLPPHKRRWNMPGG